MLLGRFGSMDSVCYHENETKFCGCFVKFQVRMDFLDCMMTRFFLSRQVIMENKVSNKFNSESALNADFNLW